MKRAISVVVSTLALTVVPGVALADGPVDTVRLANGGRLRGTVMVDDPSGVQVQLADGTTRTLKRQEVKAIEYAQQARAPEPVATAAPVAPPPMAAPSGSPRVIVSFDGTGQVSIGPLSCQAPCDLPVPPGSYDVMVDSHPVRSISVGAEPTAHYRLHRGGAGLLITGSLMVLVGSALVAGGLAMVSGNSDSAAPGGLILSGVALDLAGATLAIIGAVQSSKRKVDEVRSDQLATWRPRVLPWAMAERGAGAVGGIAVVF
jgi:hypothetical protein